MTIHHLSNAVIFYDGYDLSGDHNQVSFEHGAEMLDATVFGLTTRKSHPGLIKTSLQMSGFHDSDGSAEPDDVLFPHIGGAGRVVTVCPELAVEGDIGFGFETSRASYNPSGEVGELFKFDAQGESRTRLVKGTVVKNGTETATGNGTALQLGAVGATDTLYAIVHVIAQSGTTPTIDLKIQSDSSSGMSSPTDRITFAQIGASLTGVYATPVEGPITDDWWRAQWTIGGTTPSYTFVVLVGILPTLGS